MARNEIRPLVKLRSTAGTGYTSLRTFISEQGKVRSRRVTGLTVPTATTSHLRHQKRPRNGAAAPSRPSRAPLKPICRSVPPGHRLGTTVNVLIPSFCDAIVSVRPLAKHPDRVNVLV